MRALFDELGFERGQVDVTWENLRVAVPGELGYYGARRLQDAEPIGAMLDAGRALDRDSRYLFKLNGRTRDGASCRTGGLKRANDPRGTTRHANAELHSHGWLQL